MTAIELREHALAYAYRGWPVMPLHEPAGATGCTCYRNDCEHQGKHPRTAHGLQDATIDLDVIGSWWERWPTANIGLRTGVVFDVFDVDDEDPCAATAHLELFEIAGPTARSGRGETGGWHIYVQRTGAGNRTRMGGAALDWRGVGGLIVAPPSLHLSGRRYTWVTHPDIVPLSPCPAVLRLLVAGEDEPLAVNRGTQYPQHGRRRGRSGLNMNKWTPSGLIDRVKSATVGERNSVLHWAAWRVGSDEFAGRCTPAQADRAVSDLAVAALAAGLSLSEVEGRNGRGGTIRSGYSAGISGKGGPA